MVGWVGTRMLERPHGLILNFGVHCVRCKVNVSRPTDSAVFKRNLSKERGVCKRGEDASFWRLDKFGQIDNPAEAIGKSDPEPESSEGLHLRDTPWGARSHLCG